MKNNSVAKVTQNCLIDLHLHLDGSISIPSARELAAISKVTLPEDDNELKKLLAVAEDCTSLVDYLKTFDLPQTLLQNEEAIERCVYNLCTEMSKQGYIYAEIRFAPQFSMNEGLTQEQIVKAAIKGLDKSGFNAQLILCAMRRFDFAKMEIIDNSDLNNETLRLAKKYLGKGVCAIDIAGPEAQCPVNHYKELFAKAKELGVPYTIHAGEALGPESVDLAIEYGAQRIGHGVRSIESEKTMAILIEKRVPLELCPLSNINTGVYPSIKDEPIKSYLDRGIVVTINADNSMVSSTTVRRELQTIADVFGLTDAQIKQIFINSANAAFLSEANKKQLVDQINAEYEAK